MLNNYICALDIGSSKIAACLIRLKGKRINGIFFENLPSQGLKQGAVVNSIDLVGSITRLMKNLRAKSGINVKFVYANISGQDIITKHSHAIIPLAEKGNKVVTASDIRRVNEEARILGSSLEEEVIHLIPFSYSIDSRNNIANPLGLYSHRLEVDLYLVCGKLPVIQSLSRAVNQAGYEIKELFFSGSATSRAVLGRRGEEGLNLFCDIGSDTTEILFFRDGVLRDIEILPAGGDNLSTGLQKELKVTPDLAEDIKRSYGIISDPAQIGEDKEILIKKDSLYRPIKQRAVSQIVSALAKSLCLQIKNAVDKKAYSYEINNFTVGGRTVLLEGFIETLENILSIPVRLARLNNPALPSYIKEDSALSGQKYLTYLTALGMICQALEDESSLILPARQPAQNLFFKAVDKFKEVYQEYF